ncbi:MAG: hypothetical protein PHP70_02960 [Gallionella sp.]|nr:hypothetical protein [Gallionella sp.]
MNLMFWKKKTNPDESSDISQEKTADTETTDTDSPEAETPARAGVFAKIKSKLAALVSRFEKAPSFRAEEEQEPGKSETSEAAEEDSSAPRPANFKKRLIIGGAISLIVILLAGIVFAVLKIFMPAPKQEVDAPVVVEPARIARPVPRAEIPHAETDVTPEKIIEPQAPAPVEEPKKEMPPPEATAEPQAGDGALSVSESGDITVGNKDPQAAALSLKEAIEAMNAGSGDYTKKKAR